MLHIRLRIPQDNPCSRKVTSSIRYLLKQQSKGLTKLSSVQINPSKDRDGVSTMASGVAATRSKKLHFMNWLNQNCESLVWVGGFVSGFAQCETHSRLRFKKLLIAQLNQNFSYSNGCCAIRFLIFLFKRRAPPFKPSPISKQGAPNSNLGAENC